MLKGMEKNKGGGRNRGSQKEPQLAAPPTLTELGVDAIGFAYAVQIEALNLLGETLQEMEKATGGDAQRTRFGKGTESPPTLNELGINKKTSPRLLAR